jgi:hypothetical protein
MERDYLEKLGMDESMILKCFKEMGWSHGLD